MELKQLLINQEKALLTIEVRSSAEKLKALISDEFREIGASGAYFGLASVLERLPQEQSWQAHVQDFEFYQFSSELAQIVFRAAITTGENTHPVYSLRTSLWRNEEEQWKMLFHQGTKVEPFELSLQAEVTA